jgi:hypothetical protein
MLVSGSIPLGITMRYTNLSPSNLTESNTS